MVITNYYLLFFLKLPGPFTATFSITLTPFTRISGLAETVTRPDQRSYFSIMPRL